MTLLRTSRQPSDQGQGDHDLGHDCPFPIPADACDDKDDLKFSACALAGNAACIVSGDRALLRASGYEGIEVVKPRDFQTRFLSE